MGRGIALLFGATFGGAGIFMFAMMVNGIWMWIDSASWTQVPAQINNLELKTSRGESTTHRVLCSYQYTFAGKQFTGDTASLYNMSDNIGSFHETLYRRLKADRKAGNVTCLVDPDQPEQSMLDRTFRPGMLGFELLFVIPFGSIGLSMLTFAFCSGVDREIDGRMRIHSSNGGVRSTTKTMWLYHSLVAIIALPTSVFCLLSREPTALVPLLLASASATAAYFCFRYFWTKQPVSGKLLLPSRHAQRTSAASLLLPASWQGPVDLETRWSIPAPPSNRVGVEDKTGDADHVELPAVGGTTQQTEIELPTPRLPDKPSGDQPIKLEIMGTIGGYRYQDQFELKGRSLDWLYESAGGVQ